MKKYCKFFSPLLVFVPLWLLTIQKSYSQVSDGPRIIYWESSPTDEILIEAVQKVQGLNLKYTDISSDSLVKKLLIANRLAISHWSMLDKKTMLSYTESLVQFLQKLHPQHEHPDYIT